MKNHLSVLLLPLVLLSSPASFSETTISGNIYGGAWTTNDSPYILTGSPTATVPDGYTLTIEPGVRVLGRSYSTILRVQGTLSAVGTADNPIIFDKETTSWGGIDFEYADTSSTLKYCVFRAAISPLDLDHSNILIHDCLIEKSIGAVQAVLIDDSSPQIRRCKIVNNPAGAIKVTGTSHPEFRDILIANNEAEMYPAIYAWDCTVQLINCTIANNRSTEGTTTSRRTSVSLATGSFIKNCIFSGNMNKYDEPEDFSTYDWDWAPHVYNSIMEDPVYSVDREHNVIHASAQFKNPTMQAGGIIFEPGTANGLPVDYSLKASSPGINVGDNSVIAPNSEDLASQNRLYDGTVDAGCYEYIPAYTNGTTVDLEQAFYVSCPSEAGRKYTFWYTEDLQRNLWHPLGDIMTGTGEPVGVFDSASNSTSRYYRVTDSSE